MPIRPRVAGRCLPREECAGIYAFCAFGQFSKDRLGGSANRRKEFALALLVSDKADVAVSAAAGIGFEALLYAR